MRFAQVWALRNQAIRMQMYASVEEALENLGLSERDAHADA
jgi:hypothetical protein